MVPVILFKVIKIVHSIFAYLFIHTRKVLESDSIYGDVNDFFKNRNLFLGVGLFFILLKFIQCLVFFEIFLKLTYSF